MEKYWKNKKEILPFVTTWMDMEGIMLSEISQRKANDVCYHLYVESKKSPTQNQRVCGMVVPGLGMRTGENEGMLFKCTNLRLVDLMYCIAITDNYTIL